MTSCTISGFLTGLYHVTIVLDMQVADIASDHEYYSTESECPDCRQCDSSVPTRIVTPFGDYWHAENNLVVVKDANLCSDIVASLNPDRDFVLQTGLAILPLHFMCSPIGFGPIVDQRVPLVMWAGNDQSQEDHPVFRRVRTIFDDLLNN